MQRTKQKSRATQAIEYAESGVNIFHAYIPFLVSLFILIEIAIYPSRKKDELSLMISAVAFKRKLLLGSFVALSLFALVKEINEKTHYFSGQNFISLAMRVFANLYTSEHKKSGTREVNYVQQTNQVMQYHLNLEKAALRLLKDETRTAPLDPENSKMVLYRPGKV